MSDTTIDDLCTATSRRTGAPGAGEGMAPQLALAPAAVPFTRARRPEAASAASDAYARPDGFAAVDDMLCVKNEL